LPQHLHAISCGSGSFEPAGPGEVLCKTREIVVGNILRITFSRIGEAIRVLAIPDAGTSRR